MTRNRSHHRLTVQAADVPGRLDQVLARRLAPLSRSRVKALILAGLVAIDGDAVRDPATRVRAGQRLDLEIPPPAPARPEPQAIALNIVYEDDALIVIDKPAGLVVHPAPGNPDRTLVNALLAHCGESLRGIGGERRPGIVHRLDKDTSGLMVVAKTEAAHRSLTGQFASRRLRRVYQAVVWGVPRPARGTIAGNIGRSSRDRKKMAVLVTGGRAATTHYQVKRVLAGGIASLLECRLQTGRTHQIRVHMAEIGHPLIGDRVYGRGRRTIADHGGGISRQALHACELVLVHPETGATMRFESALPADLEELIQGLERGRPAS